MALKIRRGTQAQRLNIVPAQGELIYDTTQNKLYVGNGSTAGGIEVVGGVIGGSLGSNVNLGGYDIIGTGNINITGTITASGTITGNGDLILGNADTDNVQFGADINSNIVPNSGTLTVGTSTKPWNTVFTQNISNNANPVDVLSVLRPNNNVLPNTNGTLSLGSLSNKWSEIHSTDNYIGNLRIYENNIVSTITNQNINIETSGTGIITTSSLSTRQIDIGISNTEKIRIGGDSNSITYDLNPSTGQFNISDITTFDTYTQLVTNSAETFAFFSLNISPPPAVNVDGYEVLIRFKNSAGSQIVKIIGTIFNNTPSIQKIDEAFSGTAPIASFTTGVVSNVWNLNAVTNTSTSAGSVMIYQSKITFFSALEIPS